MRYAVTGGLFISLEILCTIKQVQGTLGNCGSENQEKKNVTRRYFETTDYHFQALKILQPFPTKHINLITSYANQETESNKALYQCEGKYARSLVFTWFLR